MEKSDSFLKNVFVKHGFDFLTMFLAVMLGFFADNYRDDGIAKKTSSQLASDLTVNISADTVTINDMLNHANEKKSKLNRLYELVSVNEALPNDSLIYVYSACVNHRPFFERHASTFALIISTGYLKNFTKDASASITEYDIYCEKTIELLKQEKIVLNSKIYPFQQQIFLTENFLSFTMDSVLVVKPILRNWNPETRWLYRNYIMELMIINESIIKQYQQLYLKAGLTIQILNKEYLSQ